MLFSIYDRLASAGLGDFGRVSNRKMVKKQKITCLFLGCLLAFGLLYLKFFHTGVSYYNDVVLRWGAVEIGECAKGENKFMKAIKTFLNAFGTSASASVFFLFILFSLCFAVQNGSKVKENSYLTDSLFPVLQRIASFKKPGVAMDYSKKAITMMNDVDSFIRKNSGNRAFLLIMEAIMNEIMTGKNVNYFLDYSKSDDEVTITDSSNNRWKKISMRQMATGVMLSVSTEGEVDFSFMFIPGTLPDMEEINGLRLRLYRLFDDFFSTDLFLRAANGD
jgi:hypothetical protein